MKRIISLCLSIVVCVTMFMQFTVFYASAAEDTVEYYIVYDKNGQIVDYNMPVSIDGKTRNMPTYLRSTKIGSGSLPNVYIGIHPETKVYRKVSSYTFSKSETVGVDFTINIGSKPYNGSTTISKSSSTGFSFTIDADQNRFSRIKVYCSFDYILYKGEQCDSYTDEVYSSFEYATFTQTHEEFRVDYQ